MEQYIMGLQVGIHFLGTSQPGLKNGSVLLSMKEQLQYLLCIINQCGSKVTWGFALDNIFYHMHMTIHTD